MAALVSVEDDNVLIGRLANGDKLVYDRPAGKACVSIEYYDKLCFLAIGGKLTRINLDIPGGLSLEDKSAALNFESYSKIYKEQKKAISIKLEE